MNNNIKIIKNVFIYIFKYLIFTVNLDKVPRSS